MGHTRCICGGTSKMISCVQGYASLYIVLLMTHYVKKRREEGWMGGVR